jgi:protein TonB
MLIIALIQPCEGQIEKRLMTNDSIQPDSVYTVVEQMPKFGMHEHSLTLYVGRNLKYPSVAREEGISGDVYIEFIISKEGKLQSPIITKGIGGGCDEEVIRVLKSVPKWSPGKHHGEAVNVKCTSVVHFILE